MASSRWLSLFLAWTLLLQSLAPALASPRPVHAPAPMQSAPPIHHGPHENHEYLVDTSQPYAEVIQERVWASNASGTQVGDSLIYRYDIGLDRLHYFKYQMPINGPPTLGSASFDGLGSTRMLVDDFGTVVDEFGYADAFGIPYRVVPGGGRAVAGPGFFLNGQQWDGGSGWGGANWSGSPAFNSGEGLYFNRARYYQPGLGRFVGQDPVLGNENIPQTLARFLYGINDPVNYVDPSGLEPEENPTWREVEKVIQEAYKSEADFWCEDVDKIGWGENNLYDKQLFDGHGWVGTAAMHNAGNSLAEPYIWQIPGAYRFAYRPDIFDYNDGVYSYNEIKPLARVGIGIADMVKYDLAFGNPQAATHGRPVFKPNWSFIAPFAFTVYNQWTLKNTIYNCVNVGGLILYTEFTSEALELLALPLVKRVSELKNILSRIKIIASGGRIAGGIAAANQSRTVRFQHSLLTGMLLGL